MRYLVAYLTSTGFAGFATSMQNMLVSWMLVGMLVLPADQAGLIQGAVAVPAIVALLWGGAIADRIDQRSLLIRIFGLAWLVPIAMAVCVFFEEFHVLTVVLFGLGMAVTNALSTPALQSILNRISEGRLQRTVSAATLIGFIVQIAALTLASFMELIGLTTVLITQGFCLVVAVLTVTWVPKTTLEPKLATSALTNIREGLRAARQSPVVLSVLTINFVALIFNAGAFNIVVPYMVKRIYDGSAADLGILMIVFYTGASLSNVIMLIAPQRFPGRLYVICQLTRAFVVALVWFAPGQTLLTALLFLWGLNMGMTSNLARTLIQEASPSQFLGRILSLFNLGMLVAIPIGVMTLGQIIEAFDTVTALIPAMVVSIGLFVAGVCVTKLWHYRSPD